jgi:hypothetical protein
VVLGQPDRPAELRRAADEPGLARPVGRDRRPAELHDRRQQRLHGGVRGQLPHPRHGGQPPGQPDPEVRLPVENSWNKSSATRRTSGPSPTTATTRRRRRPTCS